MDSVRAVHLGSRFNGDLQGYSCIFLLNVSQLDERDWGSLNRYVHEGGGLVVAPGQRGMPASYNNPTTAAQFMTTKLRATVPAGRRRSDWA